MDKKKTQQREEEEDNGDEHIINTSSGASAAGGAEADSLVDEYDIDNISDDANVNSHHHHNNHQAKSVPPRVYDDEDAIQNLSDVEDDVKRYNFVNFCLNKYQLLKLFKKPYPN